MTSQRDLQFYRNEFDVLDYFELIWEPHIDAILESLPPICRDRFSI